MDISDLYWQPVGKVFKSLRQLPSRSDEDATDLANDFVKAHQKILVDGVGFFKQPSNGSKSKLESGSSFLIGKKKLPVEPSMRPAALEVSRLLNLDECQSYVLLRRWCQSRGVDLRGEGLSPDEQQDVQATYFTERSYILACLSFILQSQRDEDDPVEKIAEELLKAGLEEKICSQVARSFGRRQNSLEGWEIIPLSQASQLTSSFADIELSSELGKVKELQEQTESSAVLDLGILLYLHHISCSADQGLDLLKALVPLLVDQSRSSSPGMQLANQALILLLAITDLPALMEAARLQKSLQKSGHGLGKPKAMADVNAELMKWTDYGCYSGSLFGVLALAWSSFIYISDSLPGQEGSDAVQWRTFSETAWQADALQTFARLVQEGKPAQGSAMGHCYRQIARDILMAAMGSFMLFPANLPSDKVQHILQIISGIFSGDENLSYEFWQEESAAAPLHHFLGQCRELFPAFQQPLLLLLDSLCNGQASTSRVNDLLHNQEQVTCRHSQDDSAVRILSGGETAEALRPLPICGTHLAIPQGTQGKILSLPALAHNVGQAESEVIEADFLVQWQVALPPGLQFPLALLQSRCSSLRRLRGQPNKESELASVLQEVEWSLQLLDRLAEGSPVSFARSALTSTTPTGLDTTSLICQVIDVLPALHANNANSRLLGCCFRVLNAIALGTPGHVADQLSGCSIFQVSQDAWFRVNQKSQLLDLTEPRLIDLEKLTNRYEGKQREYPMTLALLALTHTLLRSSLNHPLLSALVGHVVSFVLPNHGRWGFSSASQKSQISAAALAVLSTLLDSRSPKGSHGPDLRASLLASLSQPNACVYCLSSSLPPSALEVEEGCVPGDLQAAIEAWMAFVNRLFKANNPSLSFSDSFAQVWNGNSPAGILASYVSYSDWSKPEAGNPALQALASYCTNSSADLELYDDTLEQESLRAAILAPLFSPDASAIRDVQACCHIVTAALQKDSPRLAELLLSAPFRPAEPANQKQGESKALALPASASRDSADWFAEALWGVLQQADGLLTNRPEVVALVLKLLEAVWQAVSRAFQVMQELKNKPEFWKNIIAVLAHTGDTQHHLAAKASVLRILALEGRRFPPSPTGQNSVAFWKEVAGWVRGGNARDIVCKLYEPGIDYEARASDSKLSRSAWLAALEITHKLAFSMPGDRETPQSSSLISDLSTAFKPSLPLFGSLDEAMSACQELAETAAQQEDIQAALRENDLMKSLQDKDLGQILLGYAESAVQGDESSRSLDSERLQHAVGSAFVGVLPGLEDVFHCLRLCNKGYRKDLARAEVLQALHMFMLVLSLKPTEPMIKAAVHALKQITEELLPHNSQTEVLSQHPVLVSAELTAASKTCTVIAILVQGCGLHQSKVHLPGHSQMSALILQLARRWLQAAQSSVNETPCPDQVQRLITILLTLVLHFLQTMQPNAHKEGDFSQVSSELQGLVPLLCAEVNTFSSNAAECLAILAMAGRTHSMAAERRILCSSLDPTAVLQRAYTSLAQEYDSATGVGRKKTDTFERASAAGLMAMSLAVEIVQHPEPSMPISKPDLLSTVQAIASWLMDALQPVEAEPESRDSIWRALRTHWNSLLSLLGVLVWEPMSQQSSPALAAVSAITIKRLISETLSRETATSARLGLTDLQEAERSFFILCGLHQVQNSGQVVEIGLQSSIKQAATKWITLANICAAKLDWHLAGERQSEAAETDKSGSEENASYQHVQRASASDSPKHAHSPSKQIPQGSLIVHSLLAHAMSCLVQLAPQVRCQGEALDGTDWPQKQVLVEVQEDCIQLSQELAQHSFAARQWIHRFAGILLSILRTTCHLQDFLQYNLDGELASLVKECQTRLKLLLGKP